MKKTSSPDVNSNSARIYGNEESTYRQVWVGPRPSHVHNALEHELKTLKYIKKQSRSIFSYILSNEDE